MRKNKRNKERVPAEVFAPGEYIQEELDERGWAQSVLVTQLEMTPEEIADLMAGEARITPVIALALGILFGTTAQMWVNLQAAYDQAKKGR